MVESFFALRSNGVFVTSRLTVGAFTSNYTCDGTLGPAMLMPMFVLFYNTIIGRELFFHYSLNCDLDVSAPVTPQVLQSAGIGRADGLK